MPEITKTRLCYTDYTTWSLGGLGTLNGKENGKTVLVKLHYIKPHIEEGKVHTIAVGNMKLNWVGHVLDTIN